MNGNGIQIKRMADYDRDVCYEAANVFVEGYYKDLSFFTKDKEKLITTFMDAFCPDVFYLAELDGIIVGILACATNRQRAMHIDKTSMKKGLGFVMGNFAYSMLNKEFNTTLTYPDDTTYIECVATSEAARGKGVCTGLFRYVMKELPYRQFILEVADTNQTAYRLYNKLGFSEFERKKEKYSKLKGFNQRIYMNWFK
ncbi:MAG: GNAT family N-acetyltransferase [Clostridiales bacterium]|nr:GNAT family N-acetyltransferase [Clostridiales bacterium]